MPRVQGVDIPNNKAFYISLTYLYGIGRHTAIEICRRMGVEPTMKAKDMSDDDIGQLRRQTQQHIARLREIQCYRGSRHRRGLPVRGQRTSTNARTRKGVRKTVAGKKGVKDMRH
ncbi:30S ribosomal protein S13 [uncultured Rubinisphaera sp.]|uniref:30S ribosomal protein S13 n=1 Tax=uncultured Rubinisphaera sp. TaxID=1678686 RepID=UPI0030DAA562